MTRYIGILIALLLSGAAISVPGQKAPTIISRADWKANKPVGEGKKHKIEFITIHHTATKMRPDLSIETKLRNLQAFSQREDRLASGKFKPAWFDVPYHYYIAVDGKIAEGREIEYVGDTNTEYDPSGHALIVVEGSFGTDEPTSGQVESLKAMVKWLARKYKVSGEKIKGHRDYAETACPGANIEKLYPELRKIVS
ncbi:MAG: peptidoglycan recognition family protein [bacterium]|nr:peptidoglycan recognition family protein [bacterium]